MNDRGAAGLNIEAWWSSLKRDSRQWLLGNFAQPIRREVLEDLTRAAGDDASIVVASASDGRVWLVARTMNWVAQRALEEWLRTDVVEAARQLDSGESEPITLVKVRDWLSGHS